MPFRKKYILKGRNKRKYGCDLTDVSMEMGNNIMADIHLNAYIKYLVAKLARVAERTLVPLVGRTLVITQRPVAHVRLCNTDYDDDDDDESQLQSCLVIESFYNSLRIYCAWINLCRIKDCYTRQD